MHRTFPVPATLAATDVHNALQLTHDRPDFGVEAVDIDGRRRRRSSKRRSSCVRRSRRSSVRQAGRQFRRPAEGADRPGPRRPLRHPGPRHRRARCCTDHDVYVADWHNARDVPLAAGPLRTRRVHRASDRLPRADRARHPPHGRLPAAVACSPPPRIMAEDDHPAQPEQPGPDGRPGRRPGQPRTPQRFRGAPTRSRVLERTGCTSSRDRYAGAGRPCYPGFLQVGGFMGLDPRRHVDAFRGLFPDLRRRPRRRRHRTREFYAEYFAVLDITAEFYLDTVRAVFKDHDMASGHFTGAAVASTPADRIALFTIEGELTSSAARARPRRPMTLHGDPGRAPAPPLQPGVGHYGVFAGTRFDDRDLPPDPRLHPARRTADRGVSPLTPSVAPDDRTDVSLVRVGHAELRVHQCGSGPPLVLLNGIGGHVAMWEPLVRRLTGTGGWSCSTPPGRATALTSVDRHGCPGSRRWSSAYSTAWASTGWTSWATP